MQGAADPPVVSTLNPRAESFVPRFQTEFGGVVGSPTKKGEPQVAVVQDTNLKTPLLQIPEEEFEYLQGNQYEPCSDFEVLFQYDPELAVHCETLISDEPIELTTQLSHRQGMNDVSDEAVELAKIIMQSGKYNFEGLRIPLKTRWNTDLLQTWLHEYEDKQVAEFIKYGWPIDRDPNLALPNAQGRNHKGALDYPEDVDLHIQEEISFGAIVGGFKEQPFGKFGFATSPINTRPKRTSNKRRIIHDLSWGQDETSINAGLNKHQYLGIPVKLRYPTVFTLVDRIKQIKTLCLMFKKDLHKAFSQIPICPGSYRLTGFEWRKQYYFHKMMPQGLTTACLACQRTTDSIRYIQQQLGYYICNYIDDLAGAEPEEIAEQAYLQLGETIRQLGLVESPEKAVEPTEEMEFLGNLLNSKDRTISVTPERRKELIMELENWNESDFITRRQLESIIGKLQFVCNCVRSGRLFLNRLLNFLRKTKIGIKYRLPKQAHADLLWWIRCLQIFQGTSMMWYEQFQYPDEVAAADASGEAAAGVCGTQYYRAQFPEWLKHKCIAVKELWATILLLKIWGEQLKESKVLLYCDNQAVAELVNTGRARDLDLQQGLRELCYLAAVFNLEIYSVFLPGEQNRLPDLASRWWKGEKYRREFRRLAPNHTRRTVRQSLFYLSHNW